MWRVLLALLVLWRPAFLFAADQTPPPEAKDTVIVPYDPKKPLKDQRPDKVYLAYDRFLELWEAAKKTRAGEKPPPAPAAFALGASLYEGRAEEKRVTFTATIEFATFDDPWVRVPMPLDGVQISELLLDGKPAAFTEGALLVEKPGRHTLTAKFEIPLQPDVRAFSWRVPQTAATRLMLTLPETRWTARIQPDAGIIERTVDGRKIVTAALGTTANVSVALVDAEGVARLVEPALAAIETTVFSGAAFERFETTATFTFPGAKQDRFTVNFEKDLALTFLDAVGMKSWKLAEAAGRQTLEVTLAEPAKETYAFTFQCERAQAAALPADRTAPVILGGARRTERTVLLYAMPGAELKATPAAGLRQVQVARPPKDGVEFTGAWEGEGALAYRASLAEGKHEAQVDYVYQVNRRKIELIASMKLHAKGAPLFDTALTLPAGFDVQAVDSERLQDWWRDGQKLRVRFKGATPEMTPLVVYLVREYAAAPQQLDVQPLALDGFAKVTGEAVIAAHKGVDTTLKLDGNANPDPAKEIDPAKAAPDFQILPPLERKRGFAFKNQSFAGQVALAALPVKQNAVWMMHAQAHEAWASLSLKAQLTLRQGSIDRTGFSLPATLPEARVTGDEVRETRSRIEGDRRIYEVSFQNDVYDTVDFTVDVDVAMTAGKRPDGRQVNELTLPAPEFPEALLVTGYVLADNASEYELKLDTDGVEQAPNSAIPWLPSLTKGAGVFRVQPKWKVTLVLERLEKAGTRSAFCAWAQMTTALRDDGTEWHKAVWHLQNRSLQFLPVRLPDGAVLASARVAGQGVRADAGIVDGRAVILIPLIKTKPGDVSYDVEVVWLHAGERLGWRGKRKFTDAELPGITVEQTFWTVWLPEDRKLTKAEGNMEEVVEVAREVEKARSAVEELKTLNSIVSDQTVSLETRAHAQRNWSAVYSDVQKQVDYNSVILQKGRSSGEGRMKAGDKEEKVLLDKLSLFNGDVAQELSKVAAENVRAQGRPQGPQGGGGANDQSGVMNQSAQPMANPAQALLFGANNYTGQTAVSAGTLTNNATNAQTDARVSGLQSSANITGGTQRGVTLNNTNEGGLLINGAGGGAPQTQRWAVNPANPTIKTPQQELVTAPPTTNNNTNFYLNDNIVLQQEKKQQVAEPAKKPAEGVAMPKGKLYQSVDELVFESKEVAQAGKKGEAKNQEQQMEGDLGRGLNVARGNRLQQAEQSQYRIAQGVGQLPGAAGQQGAQPQRPATPADPAAPQSQPAPEAKPALPTPLVQPPMSQTTPMTPALRPGDQMSPVNPGLLPPALPGGFNNRLDGRQNIPPQSGNVVAQPTGRLALSMDFPTEGHEYHFQKVKASAVLELKFSDPKLLQRCIRIGIFAALALLLSLLSHRLHTRRA